MKIMVTGPRGFVGAKLMEYYPDAIAAPSLRDISEDAVKAMIDRYQPEVILHTAAISDIPTCAANPEASYRANVVLPELLAKNTPGIKLVAFSSDQVYTGCVSDGPYDESVAAGTNLYAQHKIEMERRVLEADPDAVLLRAEWMYDWIAPKGNYIRNVLGGDALRFSSREFRGVTYVQEVCRNMDNVMKLPGGAYNFGSETRLSMYEVTRQFLDWMGRDTPVQDCDPHHNLWMDCSKARRYGVDFSDILDGVKKCALENGLK